MARGLRSARDIKPSESKGGTENDGIRSDGTAGSGGLGNDRPSAAIRAGYCLRLVPWAGIGNDPFELAASAPDHPSAAPGCRLAGSVDGWYCRTVREPQRTTMQRVTGAPPRRKLQWKRAWTALKKLTDDPQRTEEVFEIIRALAGNSFERSYQRFCAHPDGRRLLQERPSLLAVLSDRDGLRALPEGSFGRAYLEFMETAQLDAKGLV